MLLIDEEAALAAIPSMLPPDTAVRGKAFGLIKEILSARGEITAADTERWTEWRSCSTSMPKAILPATSCALPSVRGDSVRQGVLSKHVLPETS